MTTFIYVSLVIYAIWQTVFLTCAWRCKSPAFGKLEIALFGLLSMADIILYLTWLIPMPAGWITKILIMVAMGVVRTGVHLLIHWQFSPFRFTLRSSWMDWMERCSTLTSF